MLRILGNTSSKRVTATLGGEQEYFLIDRKFVEEREDLRLAGRTLFGAPSPKGQELEDQYFGTLHERVASFMADLNEELWKLGVLAKTQHNEVAPAQHEIAPVYATVNIGVDHNQLTMELMQRKVINIEARTMLNMARRQILPAIMSYGADVAYGVNSLKAAGVKPEAQSRLLKRLNAAVKDVDQAIANLAGAVEVAGAKGHADEKAEAYRDLVVPAMAKLRAASDSVEPVVGAEYWPLPTYADMLFCR